MHNKVHSFIKQNQVYMRESVKIKLHEYYYSCGDGCCSNYGTITTVNGVEMESHNQDVQTILEQVLTHLGYKVEIETTYDNQ